jgi:hypothetical protein
MRVEHDALLKIACEIPIVSNRGDPYKIMNLQLAGLPEFIRRICGGQVGQ